MKEKLFKFLFPSKHKELETANRALELTKKALASANSDIRELVLKPQSQKSIAIKMATSITNDLERSIWFGDPNEEMR